MVGEETGLVQLGDLLGGERATNGVDITGLTADSRAVEPGFLFAALEGTKTDGRDFIPDALDKGAAAILAAPGRTLDVGDAALVLDTNPRRRFAQMAACYYGRQPDVVVAVTGTNGKTSVASFTRQIWQAIGARAGSVGTLGVHSQALTWPAGLTTPDPVALHKALAQLAEAGVGHVAVEASSHGLAQYRLDAVRLSAAAFTNLTRDHFDYHGSVEAYLYAKARLFGELLPPGGTAVSNLDGAFGREMDNLAWARGLRRISVGRAEDAAIRIVAQEPRFDGQQLAVAFDGRRYDVHLPLIGGFQAENALVAAGLVIATGGMAEAAFTALERLSGVPGRLERVGVTPAGGAVYVDYAHTPDGLETVLEAARTHAQGKLGVVFGCGGDRDRGKRPEMGAIAAQLADTVVVTDDNPRSEDPAAIRREILIACPEATEIGDRGQAITATVAGLGAGDVLVVAGKGHEEGQLVGDRVLPFSDLDAVADAIARLGEETRR